MRTILSTLAMLAIVIVAGAVIGSLAEEVYADEPPELLPPGHATAEEMEALRERVGELERAMRYVERANFFNVSLTATDLEDYIFPLTHNLLPYLDGYWPEAWEHRHRVDYSIGKCLSWWLVARANDRDIDASDLQTASEIADAIKEYLDGS